MTQAFCPNISAGFLTPYSFFQNWENVKRLMQLWQENFPQSFPDRYGQDEPIRKRLSSAKTEDLKDYLDIRGLIHFARSRPPSIYSSIIIEDLFNSNNHAGLNLTVEYSPGIEELMTAFISTVSKEFCAHFAYVHRPILSDRQPGIWNSNGIFICTPTLKKGIPNMFWTTLFGVPFLEAIGRKAFVESRPHKLEWISPDIAAVTIAEDVNDSINHPGEFEIERARVREALGLKFFWPYSLTESPLRF